MRSLPHALIAILCLSSVSGAQVPDRLPYSGRLVKTNGAPETGVVNFSFQIFDSATGGTALWSESQSLMLNADGLYSTELGGNTALGTLFTTPGARFLEVSVNNVPLTPRQPISSVPWALMAKNVRGGFADVTSLRVAGVELVSPSGTLLPGAITASPDGGLVVNGVNGSLGLRPCADGQALIFDGPSASWRCGTPTGMPGQSVTTTAELPGNNCDAGGIRVVSASGTAFVCNGATGSQGPQGAPGATGSQGPQGAPGATGSQGSQGAPGATGSQGPQGPPGSTRFGGAYTRDSEGECATVNPQTGDCTCPAGFSPANGSRITVCQN